MSYKQSMDILLTIIIIIVVILHFGKVNNSVAVSINCAIYDKSHLSLSLSQKVSLIT